MNNSRFTLAVHVLTMLAMDGTTPVSSEFLANSAGTNPVVIRRILSQLRSAGLIVVQAGCLGGARLAHPPDTITLFHVSKAVGGISPFSLGRRKPDLECVTGRNLQPILNNVLVQAEKAMALFLQGITVAQIVGEIRRREKLLESGDIPI